MSLNLSKLEHVRERRGRIIAQCPACAEEGADRSGEHLVIMEAGNGQFGCIAHTGPHGRDHRRRIAQLVGSSTPTVPCRTVPRPPAKPARAPALSDLRRPTAEELLQIARTRAWPTADGMEVLVERGLLLVGMVWDDGREWPGWIVTDPTRANAQARKLDGGLWTGIGGKKVKSLPGTTAARCIGASCIGASPEVWLMEGTPDLLAAPIVARQGGLNPDRLAFVCMTGGGNNIAAKDLAHFTGKKVIIAMHHDADHGKGKEAAKRWSDQLYLAGAVQVRGFDFAKRGKGVKDLSDYLAVSQLHPPAAPSNLVPLDVPFVDGQRYRLAPATEVSNRLELFVADPSGPWIRRHGVLLKSDATTNPSFI